MTLKSIIALPVIVLLFSGCASNKPLEVTGKSYLTPQFAPSWLEPCQPPVMPVSLSEKGDVTTQRELLTYITNLITTIDKCNLKLDSIRTTYQKFKDVIRDNED
jgi:hypothetical protein